MKICFCVKHKIPWYNIVWDLCAKMNAVLRPSIYCLASEISLSGICTWRGYQAVQKLLLKPIPKTLLMNIRTSYFFPLVKWMLSKYAKLSTPRYPYLNKVMESGKFSNLNTIREAPVSRAPCSCIVPLLPGGICQLIWPG